MTDLDLTKLRKEIDSLQPTKGEPDMTNHPTRAEWWREVTDPNGVIPKGCPVRTEYGGARDGIQDNLRVDSRGVLRKRQTIR